MFTEGANVWMEAGVEMTVPLLGENECHAAQDEHADMLLRNVFKMSQMCLNEYKL